MTALEGYVPTDVIKTFNAFLDFCYIARKNILTEDTLTDLDTALERFHYYREIFRVSGVQPNRFSLPHQHSLKHYCRHIENFRAPNGLCSSITESKHIEAVKKPWQWSNRYKALKQMLVINMRNDKLAVARADFIARGMLHGTCLGEALQAQGHDLSSNTGNLDDKDEFSGPDGNGEGGSDLDMEGEDDSGAPGPVDGPPVFSEAVLAQKRGTQPHPFPSSQTSTHLSIQPGGTPVPHSTRLGSTLAKQTLMILFGSFFFTNRTQLPTEPPHLTLGANPSFPGQDIKGTLPRNAQCTEDVPTWNIARKF